LRYLVHRGYHFKHLIMIFIPEDFFRHKSQWPEGALRCLQNIADCQGRFFYPLVPGLDLIKTSAERAMDRGYSFRDRLGYFAQRYFWVSYFLQERVRDILTGNRQWHEITPRIGAALDHMAAGPQTLHLVRVVQKDEEGLRTDNAASALVKKYLSGRELPFAVCRLGYDGYLSYDGHPNSRGYARLATCVAAVIRGLDIHGG